MKKYRIFCETDNRYEEVIASAEPSQCPSVSNHIVDLSTISIIEEDVKVNDGTLKDLTLADYKQLRYNEIDYKTGLLIGAGFTFDSKQFSLSVPAQMNWNALKTNETDFTFPVTITTIDNDEYSLAQVDLNAFWTAGRDKVQSTIDAGRSLKKQIFDAVDEASVDLVIDNR